VDYTTNLDKFRWLLVICSFVAVVLVLILMGSHYMHRLDHKEKQMYNLYRVMIEGETIGAVSSPSVVWDWLEQKRTTVQQQYPNVQSGVSIGEIYLEREQQETNLINDQGITDELEKRSTIYKRGVQIRIDGKPLGFVKDEAAADSLLEQYKQSKISHMAPYTSDIEPVPTSTNMSTSTISAKGKVRILSASRDNQQAAIQPAVLQDAQFVQHIELVTMDIQPEEITDNEALLNKITTGDVQPFQYKVLPGDCISCIAYKLNIDKQVIYDNNPQIKNNLIRIGEELDLTVLQPLLALKTVEQRLSSVEVPFSTEYIEDDTLKVGIQEIISDGVPGLKQVAMNTTRIDGEFIEETEVGETLIRPATQAIVKKGTLIVPGIGTGQFAWPVYRAKLTSDYGKRWGSFHPGTDMVSEHSGIVASDHGKVIFAGWKTGYGNCIIIDHENGYSTLYGHLSKISVVVDERIQKGDKIGIMGSTGQATGVHLHFEIRKGEQQENPMKYLGNLD
jgi:murein DD-endopeptidase MepM/ murein hydrolase activator NlpD